MKVLLTITSIILFLVWCISMYAMNVSVDVGEVVHAFLIGAIGLFIIKLVYYGNPV